MQTRARIQRRSWNVGKRQQGVILVMVALALLPMLGLVGVAIDGAHGMLNKSRLQNTVDAAALSAAKTPIRPMVMDAGRRGSAGHVRSERFGAR
jgi:Flp pilus assembly protein TadG